MSTPDHILSETSDRYHSDATRPRTPADKAPGELRLDHGCRHRDAEDLTPDDLDGLWMVLRDDGLIDISDSRRAAEEFADMVQSAHRTMGYLPCVEVISGPEYRLRHPARPRRPAQTPNP